MLTVTIRQKKYVTSTNLSSTAYGNPDILEARPHLRICGKLLCRNFLPAVRQTLAAPDYHKYLKEKLTWTQQDLNNVNWPTMQSAMSLFQPGKQQRILLFINDKLPLLTSKAHPHKGSTLCPLCQCKPEDHWHFLECPHQDHAKLFTELKRSLTNATRHFQLHPCLHTAIWLG